MMALMLDSPSRFAASDFVVIDPPAWFSIRTPSARRPASARGLCTFQQLALLVKRAPRPGVGFRVLLWLVARKRGTNDYAGSASPRARRAAISVPFGDIE